MSQSRTVVSLIVIIMIVIAPSMLSLGWYYFSKNPSLRPLGITKQALSAYEGSGEGLEIIAYVDWVPPKAGNYTQAQLSRVLSQSFAAKGAEVRIEFRDGRGSTQVTYRVGKTVLGPFPTARASEGISAAVEAFNMH